MNIWGKIALFLVVIGGIAGATLASKSFDVRGSWAKQLDQLKGRNVSNAETLLKEKQRYQQLAAEYQRLKVGYGDFWTDVETEVVDRVEGLVHVEQLGTNQGLMVNEEGAPTIIYGFQPAGDGKYLYVGSFIVDGISEDACDLRAMWKVRPNETGLWEDGDWRWRSEYPESATSRIDRLHNRLNVEDEKNISQKNQQKIQEGLLKNSEKQLDLRLQQLLSETDGLIQALEKESNKRDQSLKEMDQLRLELKNAVDLRTSLVKKIRLLKTELPKASESPETTKISQNKSL